MQSISEETNGTNFCSRVDTKLPRIGSESVCSNCSRLKLEFGQMIIARWSPRNVEIDPNSTTTPCEADVLTQAQDSNSPANTEPAQSPELVGEGCTQDRSLANVLPLRPWGLNDDFAFQFLQHSPQSFDQFDRWSQGFTASPPIPISAPIGIFRYPMSYEDHAPSRIPRLRVDGRPPESQHLP